MSQISTGTFGVSKFVVSPDPTQGNYTTISSALADTSSGDTVYVCDGVYNETIDDSITSLDGITLSALGNQNAHIIGKISIANQANFTVNNIQIEVTTGYCLEISGTDTIVVNANNCYFYMGSGSGVSFTNTDPSSSVNLYRCNGNTAASGAIVFSVSGVTPTSSLNIKYCDFVNTGGSVSASNADSGIVNIMFSSFLSALSNSGTNVMYFGQSVVDTSVLNIVTMAAGGTGSTSVNQSQFLSGTSVSVTIDSGSSAYLFDSIITSTNSGGGISGAGLCSSGGLSFNGTGSPSDVINNAGSGGIGSIQGIYPTVAFPYPRPGFLGEVQAIPGVPVNAPNGTPVSTLPSGITIPPGIWLICTNGSYFQTVGAFVGTDAVCAFGVTYGSSPNLFTVYVPVLAPATTTQRTSSCALSFILQVTSTTTYNLWGVANFTGGTVQFGGNVTATRIG